MKIYISGKITGLPPLDVFASFDEAADSIRMAGHIPVNPANIGALLPGLKWESYMTIAYGIVTDPSIDAIYMLKGWQDSKGAVIEWGWAMARGIEILYQDPADYRKYERR